MRPARGPGQLWIPAVVLVVGGAVSLFVWSLLLEERRQQLLSSAGEAAAETRSALELRIATQAEALSDLARRWGRFGVESDAEWQAEAEALVDRLPGLEALAWFDPGRSGTARTHAEARPGEALKLSDEDLRRHGDRPDFTPVEIGADGIARYRVFLPARRNGAALGLLVAGVRVEPLLDAVLRGRARGYALTVVASDRTVYARDGAAGGSRRAWWSATEAVGLPFGGSWELVLRPTPALAAARLTPLPHYLLAAGLLVSALLAVLVHQLSHSSRQARFLAAANQALHSADAELRLLNEELESRVAARTDELREAVADLESFNYSVSHDLRSPLGAILNFTAILEEDHGAALDPDAVEILQRIRRSAIRASALLDDLLRLSRAGRAALELEELDLESVARDAFLHVRAAHPNEDVALEVAALPRVRGDRNLVSDVFANLFSNAVKYSRGREDRRILVDAKEHADELCVQVSDNGHGFDPRFAAKMFGVFERLHADGETEGTGVGLAIVARIVRRHGGRVWANGEPGAGARISFTLPRGEAATS